MALGKRVDPLPVSSFHLDISGKCQGTFRECTGLGSASEVIEHKSAAKSGQIIVQKVPGNLKYENIVLKRGVTDDMQVWDWRKMVEDGKIEEARMNGTITMYDQTNKAMAEWTFDNAWPVKVSGPTLNAGANEIAIEELHIAHEGMRRNKT